MARLYLEISEVQKLEECIGWLSNPDHELVIGVDAIVVDDDIFTKHEMSDRIIEARNKIYHAKKEMDELIKEIDTHQFNQTYK